MDPTFRARIESLEPLLSQLKAMTPVKPEHLLTDFGDTSTARRARGQ